MEFIHKYIQGIDKPHILIAEIITISIISNYITYILVFHYKLSWLEMLCVITILLVITALLVNYLTPLKFLQDILNDMKRINVFGITIFGTANVFTNMFMLYKHYGLLNTAAICFGATTLAGFFVTAVHEYLSNVLGFDE